MSELDIQKYARKPFYVEAVGPVTIANMPAICEWSGGVEGHDDNGMRHIHIEVPQAQNERQTKAYVGDWVLKAGRQYKVYTAKAFKKAFDLVESPGLQPSQNAELEAELTEASEKFVELVTPA